MQILNKLLNKKIYTITIALINFVFWVITFAIRKNNPNGCLSLDILENTQLIVISVIFSFVAIFIDDLYYIVPIIFFFPFLYSRPMSAINIPIGTFIALGVVLISLIVHFIHYKTLFKIGKNLLGLIAFCLALILGGIFNINNLSLIQFLLTLGLSIGIIFAYIFLSSNLKTDFEDICFLMNIFAFFLLLQVISFYLIYPVAIDEKGLRLGWGVGNNVGLFLLFTIPFAFYKGFSLQTPKRFIYFLYACLQYIGIIFAYSRGCIAIGFIEMLLLVLIGIKYAKKDLLKYLGIFLGGAFILISIILIICLCIPAYWDKLLGIIFGGLNFSSMNNRTEIWSNFLSKGMDQFLFGHGLLYPLEFRIDVDPGNYQWAHNTFLHMFFTCGSVGVLLLIYHLVEKYFGLIKKINLKKFTILLSYTFSGLYGMFDISYLYINYMVVFLLVMIMMDNKLERLIHLPALEKFYN